MKHCYIRCIMLVFIFTATLPVKYFSQSGTDFWFAPPDVTDLHNSPGGEPLYLLVSSTGQAATVTISQPANAGFNGGSPIVLNVAANKSTRLNLTPFKAALETRPTNTVLNTGLRIQSTAPITAYYEVSNTNNTDIFALKGANGIGSEFYIPLHKHAPFYNHTFASPHPAYASFDIVATENNTTVTIYSPVAVDGHPALQQFSISLNQGQTYSCGFTGTNYEQPSTHPAGAVVLSDKPVAVTIKDDSNHNPSGGCFDLMGDQIVPVNILGTDYIAVKGSLNNNGDESVIIVATENNTKIYLDGSGTAVATLFAGEYYRVDMDYLSASANNAVYINATKPIYAIHVTGFGCEMGQAVLPPLNCAGSTSVNFVRSSSESFFVTILVRAAAANNFSITGPGTATINPASFVVVPGTGGVWMAARIQYNTTQVPVDSTFTVANSADVFALGIINGGAATGCRYGYFSEFVAPITVNAGTNISVCANDTAQLSGSVSGGTTTGIWTSSGTGNFLPNNNTLNAKYRPSAADASVGTVTLTLTSTGSCIPQNDVTILTITPAPTVNAGVNQNICKNNPTAILSGSVTIATGGVWTGGAGTFTPNNSTLNASYTPTAAELTAGSVTLILTSTGNGICNPVSDNVIINYTPAPTVSAGGNQSVCANNPNVTLNGFVTVASGGIWSGGTGSYNPSQSALNAIYTPSASEITAGSVKLYLTTTGNGNCNAVTDSMTITFTLPPTANAGTPQSVCANNPTIVLNGGVTIASGGQWSGGLGVFSPSSTALNATYTPTTAEIAAGSMILMLTTTGNGNCNAVSSNLTINFTTAPTANANNNQTVCANNPNVTLNGTFTIATGAVWSGGTGTYTPNNTTMNAVYTPSPSEILAGTVTLTLTTTGNGNCNPATDDMTITITPAPIVNAGTDINACVNNASVNLNGSVFNALGGSWSGGAGSYNPNNTTFNAIYTPSAAEISAGSVALTLTSTGNGNCLAVSDVVQINFAPSPVANAGIDQTLCKNNATVSLNGFVNFCAGGQWSNGIGSYNPSNNSLTTTYTPTAGEIATGFIELILTTTGNGSCNAVKDTIRINFNDAPTVNAGTPLISCNNNSSVTLNGSYTIATAAIWSGAGIFSPNNTTMNAIYTPSSSEVSAGIATLTLTTTGNGNCLPVTSTVSITINQAPSVNAGNDQITCVTNLNIPLSGSIAGITNTGQWSTSGSGTFNPNNTTLNATYTCSSTDSLNGFVYLILSSTNNGPCNTVTDTVRINISPAGTAFAGIDRTVCSNNASVTLNGAVGGGATSGLWSTTGTGTFVPNANALNATYIPSAYDKNQGSVILILNATSCNNAKDSLVVSITPAPIVNAGNDITQCASIKTATLSGLVSGTSTTGVWASSGTGTFSPNNTTLNAVYHASAADSVAQVIYLILTSTNNGSCVAVSDTMRLNLYPTGIVNAGSDQTLCSNNPNVTINGSITGGATLGQWSTSGSGIFIPNNTTLNATYIPSAGDLIAGSVNLVLNATNSCNSAADFLVASFTPAPQTNAGSNHTVCANNPLISLSGNITNATGGIWSGGSGIYNPNNTTLNANYTPSASEIASGFVNLILTSTGNGNCNAEDDTVTIAITPAPVVNAGVNQSVCRGSSSAQLQGIVASGSTTGKWQTLGSGTFLPNDSALNAVYQFSTADTSAGTVTLILTSTNNGFCLAKSDTMTITFGPSAFAFAGYDQSVCESSATATLNGIVSGGSGTGQWTSMGTGNFSPNDSTLNANYTLSASDISAGSVSLILSSTNNGACLAGRDTVVIFVTLAPQVYAGGNQSVCSNNLSINLNGVVNGASSTGIWSTNGSGSFTPNNITLNTTYNLSANDSLNGTVKLILTTTNTGVCASVSDTTTITVRPLAIVDAGTNQTLCSNTNPITLNGNVSGGSITGQWSTLGSGIFNPSDTTLNANYTASAADINSGSVQLILTSTHNGICNAQKDTILITLEQLATVNAGNNIVICGSTDTVSLNGSVVGYSTTGQWSTSGTGTFVPNANSLNAVYRLSGSDKTTGNVRLVLTSTNNGVCNAVKDTINITVEPLPTAAFIFTVSADEFVNFIDQSVGAASWHWQFGNTGGSSTQQHPTYLFTETGSHQVTLVITSLGGCMDTASAIVTTSDLIEKPIEVPSGYTPNKDGLNDKVRPLGGPFTEIEFKIFNQWGNEIFSTTDPNDGWDGTYKGKTQPEGVYTYTLKGITIKGIAVAKSGSITLLR